MLNSATLAPSGNASPDLHQTAATRFIEVNGTRYAYRTFGNNTGIPLIFLQHFTGTIDYWDPAITDGFARYYQVVLFDNKGIGASEGETPDNIEAMAQDAISFIKALGFNEVNLLGFSMGGFIAQQIALEEPDLISKLILVGTGPKTAEGLADIVKPLTESASMSPHDQMLYLFYSSTPTSRALGQESLARINKRTVNRDPDTGMAAIQAQLKSMLSWAQPDADALDKLKQIRQPVLIVNGHNDIMVPTVNSYILFQNLPNAKLSLYPDSGHGSFFQYPELFLSEAVSFLEAN